MTIEELTTKLTVEFKDFAKGYSLADYNYYADLADDFIADYTISYFLDDKEKSKQFLNSLDTAEVAELVYEMARHYDDFNVVVYWLGDPEELANEIVGYVVKNYVIDKLDN